MTVLVDPRDQAEKGRASLGTPGGRFAYRLSRFTSPFVVGPGVFCYIALSRASTVSMALQWLTVIGLGLLVPFGFVWWGATKEKWIDLHVSRRSARLLSLWGMLAGLLLLSTSRPLVATLVAVIASFALATLITNVTKYKISLHIDSAADAVMVSCLLVSSVFLVLFPLVMLIAWARWKLEAHNPLQALYPTRCATRYDP
jgi:hypothetical protein